MKIGVRILIGIILSVGGSVLLFFIGYNMIQNHNENIMKEISQTKMVYGIVEDAEMFPRIEGEAFTSIWGYMLQNDDKIYMTGHQLPHNLENEYYLNIKIGDSIQFKIINSAYYKDKKHLQILEIYHRNNKIDGTDIKSNILVDRHHWLLTRYYRLPLAFYLLMIYIMIIMMYTLQPIRENILKKKNEK